jgi:hypothetical protein
MRRYFLLACTLTIACITGTLAAQAPSSANSQTQASAQHDGSHDFDFEDGSWNIHLKRRVHPLTGSTQWVEFDGRSTTQKLWDGAAHLEQFETSGAGGQVQGLTYRLYRPEARQWYIYWVNRKDGILGTPMVGGFKNGVGEFYDQEEFNGRMIYVRFIWSAMTANSAHFEQSFSDDGGKTWEVNWITDQTRTK